jgi:hypothetical protein
MQVQTSTYHKCRVRYERLGSPVCLPQSVKPPRGGYVSVLGHLHEVLNAILLWVTGHDLQGGLALGQHNRGRFLMASARILGVPSLQQRAERARSRTSASDIIAQREA